MLLVRSLKLINKQDMLDVGAVSDLRSYLVAQEAVGSNTSLAVFFVVHIASSRRHCEKSWLMNSTATCTSSHSGANRGGQYTPLVNKRVSVLWFYSPSLDS